MGNRVATSLITSFNQMPFLQANSAQSIIEHLATDTFATNAKAFVEHLMRVT
jgi:hypothetical protein